MIYENEKMNIDILLMHVKRLGMKKGQFCEQIFGSKSHNSFKYFEDKDIKVSSIIKICNLLGIHFDDLFIGPKQDGNTPYIFGNGNIQNSTVILNDIATLKAENKSQKEMIDMLKKEKADLGRRLDNVIDLIRKSDSIK